MRWQRSPQSLHQWKIPLLLYLLPLQRSRVRPFSVPESSISHSGALSFVLFHCPVPLRSSSAHSVAAAFPSPPTLSLPPPLSRVGLGDKDRAPVPQAVVKPQVLTHLIEGFVIQEGAEPFPVSVLGEVDSGWSEIDPTNGSFQPFFFRLTRQVAGLLKDRDFALAGRSENGPACE